MSGIFTINFADFTYEATPTSIWSVTEIGTAIIVASSPIIRPLFDRVFHSIVSSARTNNRYTYNNNSNNQTLKSITKASGFDRLGGEEIPLQDIERGGVVATVTAGTPSASTKSVEDFHSYMSRWIRPFISQMRVRARRNDGRMEVWSCEIDLLQSFFERFSVVTKVIIHIRIHYDTYISSL
jgi:hypothetical protein